MLKSMTAYGRSSAASKVGRFTVEIQSVNRKHLEVNTFLPKELLRFDTDIKKWIAQEVFRGQVNVRVTAHFEGAGPLMVTPNLPLARQLKACWDAIAKDLQIETDFKIELLRHQQDLFFYDDNLKDEEAYKEVLHDTLQVALKQLLEMKSREGSALHDDIAQRVVKLHHEIEAIALKAPEATKKYRQKLIERLEEVMGKNIEHEERILREVSIYAERVDIAEEITRFKSHLNQFDLLLKSDTESLGKTMEFVIQELNREINTISSKSSDLEVSQRVVEMKGELERIREQIQNVE